MPNELTVQPSEMLPANLAELFKADVAEAFTIPAGGGIKRIEFDSGEIIVDGTNFGRGPLEVYALAECRVNSYYSVPWRPKMDPVSPDCYALFAKDEEEAVAMPHPKSCKPVLGRDDKPVGCLNCPKNAWDSGRDNKGKACQNARRLAVLIAGTWVQTPQGPQFQYFAADGLAAQEIHYMRLSVTASFKKGPWLKYRQANALRGLPIYAYTTKITTTPDSETQYKLHMDHGIDQTDPDCIRVLMGKRQEAASEIMYPFFEPEPDTKSIPNQAVAGQVKL